MINSYEVVDIGGGNVRYNYGLRTIYSSNVYGATYVRLFIGNTERAYCSTSGMNNSSLAEQKAEIHDAGSALALVRDARLYRYRNTISPVESRTAPAPQALEESEPAPPAEPTPPAAPELSPERVGFVIGDGYDPPPACVLAEDGRGINLYAMISVCWKAIQELSAKLEGGNP